MEEVEVCQKRDRTTSDELEAQSAQASPWANLKKNVLSSFGGPDAPV
jgi:hypothetical protein